MITDQLVSAKQAHYDLPVRRRPLPSQDYLLSRLRYEPETGKLFWRARTPDTCRPGNIGADATCRAWNGRRAGKEAFTAERLGYRTGSIDGKTHYAHRVIWKMVTGDDPDTIDHINGHQGDNRWKNLRSVDPGDNCRNAKLRSDSSTGAAGVYWCDNVSAYRVRITKAGRQINLGYFRRFEDAVRCREQAKLDHGFTQRHGR